MASPLGCITSMTGYRSQQTGMKVSSVVTKALGITNSEYHEKIPETLIRRPLTAQKIVPPRLRIPMMEGALVPSPKRSASPRATFDTVSADSLKALDLDRPIREADMLCPS